jgi:hypothetical protein
MENKKGVFRQIDGLTPGAAEDFGERNCQYTIPKAFGIDAK